MDEIDRAILHLLQTDGRMQNNELAERVGLSPSPCLRRTKRLEDRGVIAGYAAIVDRHQAGCDYEPLVWVTLDQITRDAMTSFETAVQGIPNIVEALRMMGQPDYLLRIVTSDAKAFEELYMDTLATLPHVQKLTSQLAMTSVKRTHVIPIEHPRVTQASG